MFKLVQNEIWIPLKIWLCTALHKDEKVVLLHEDMQLWVLDTDIMCSDLVKFSCSESLSHPIRIDPTFNMGPIPIVHAPDVSKHFPLSCSPNFPRALYLDERTLTYEPIVNFNIASKFV